jgi:hypothetical protein
MPQMITQIAKSDRNIDVNIVVDQVTKSGATLRDHWNDQDAIHKIQSKNWDYVIYQEESNWALSKFGYEKSYRVAPKFKAVGASSVKHSLLFVTWPRKDHSTWYRGKTGGFFKNYNYMSNQINLRSQKLANNLGASLMNIGSYWDFMNKNYPNINLYEKDASHPNITGSYLNALLFYKVITKSKNIANIDYVPQGVTKENATIIRTIVAG